jgi:hypothetical protein
MAEDEEGATSWVGLGGRGGEEAGMLGPAVAYFGDGGGSQPVRGCGDVGQVAFDGGEELFAGLLAVVLQRRRW